MHRRRECSFSATLLAAFIISVAFSIDSAARQMPEFSLTDQDGRTRAVSYPHGKVSVFVVADQKGSADIAGWIAPLSKRYEQRIEVAGIAALPGIPPMFQGLFRREFKKRLTFPVMLDWTGDVARSVGYENNRAQLLVVGRSGRIALMKSGPANEQALADVMGEIDRLRAER
jgi:hypothetical protein